jgi:hypothetical protein
VKGCNIPASGGFIEQVKNKLNEIRHSLLAQLGLLAHLAFNIPARDRTGTTVAGLKAEYSEPGFT